MKHIAFSLLLFFSIPLFCMKREEENKSEDLSIEKRELSNQNSNLSQTRPLLANQKSSRKWQKRAVQCMEIFGKGIKRFEQIIPYYLSLQSLGLGLEIAYLPDDCSYNFYDTMGDSLIILIFSPGLVVPQMCGDLYRHSDSQERSWLNPPPRSMFKKCLKTVLRDTIPYAQLIFNLYVAYQLSHTPDPPSCNTVEDPSEYCKMEQENSEGCNILQKTGNALFWSSLSLFAVKARRIRKLIPKIPWRRFCSTLPI